MPDDRVNVVFQYTTGDLKGGRFYTKYPLGDLKKIRAKTLEPKSRVKIVAEGITDAEAKAMCLQAIADNPGLLLRDQLSS